MFFAPTGRRMVAGGEAFNPLARSSRRGDRRRVENATPGRCILPPESKTIERGLDAIDGGMAGLPSRHHAWRGQPVPFPRLVGWRDWGPVKLGQWRLRMIPRPLNPGPRTGSLQPGPPSCAPSGRRNGNNPEERLFRPCLMGRCTEEERRNEIGYGDFCMVRGVCMSDLAV